MELAKLAMALSWNEMKWAFCHDIEKCREKRKEKQNRNSEKFSSHLACCRVIKHNLSAFYCVVSWTKTVKSEKWLHDDWNMILTLIVVSNPNQKISEKRPVSSRSFVCQWEKKNQNFNSRKKSVNW